MPSSPRARMSAVLVLTALVVGACTPDDDASVTSTTGVATSGSAAAPPAPSTAAPETTVAATITVATTAPPPSTTEPPAATDPTTPTTTPTTTPAATPATTVPPSTPTTLPPTTTTEPVAVEELILRGDGIGSARFGAAPEGVIDYITSILGGNTGDTGWVDPFTFAVCDGTVARRVDWGVLSLLFSDLSDVADGRRHFMGYEYGRVGQVGDEPVGLRTEGGTMLGSRVVDLLAEFPDASVNPGETDVDIPPNFYVSNNFYGLITGVDPEDVVTVMFGGYGCGA